MKQRRLGESGPEVSAIGLGCMAMAGWYGVRDDREATATIHRAIDVGVTFLDTADLYGAGENETFVGRAVRDRRNQVFFATKFGNTWDERGWPVGVNGRPEYAAKACDASLGRLGFDHIDLYYLHRVDPDVPIEETVGAMSRLVEAGKVRYIGVSEAGPDSLRRGHAVHPFAALQTEYSLWSRDPEQGLFALCEALGIGFVAYSPLGRGMLTGEVRRVDELPDGDIRKLLPRFEQDNIDRNRRLLDLLTEMAAENRCTPPQLALAWILEKQPNVVPIQGADRRRFLDENAGAAEVALTAEAIARLDEAMPPGAAAGARYPDDMMEQVDR